MESRIEYVIYDGECGICEEFRKFVSLRIQPGRKIQFVPYQFAEWDRLPPKVTLEKAQKAVCFINKEKEISWGMTAIARILLTCRFPFFILGRVVSLPPLLFICKPLYRWVANNRARISTYLGFRSCRLS